MGVQWYKECSTYCQFELQASRSLPAIGMKQTPKKRVKKILAVAAFLCLAVISASFRCPNRLQISLFDHMVSKDELIEAKIQEVSVCRHHV